MSEDRSLQDLGISNEVAVPCLWGIPLKYISLVTLAAQNSLLTIIMHYSRVYTPPSQTYSATLAVLLNEVLKGAISLAIAFSLIEKPPMLYSNTHLPIFANSRRSCNFRVFSYRMRRLGREVFSPDSWKLCIPAILYVIQNNLQYIAASNLDAATFQVSYQMKILTTAGFSVILLRKRLSPSQWLALVCLAIGVGIVQIQAGKSTHPKTVVSDIRTMIPFKGLMAVGAACFTSGLAGVYFEMVLKNSQANLWVRNVQLSLFSLIPALVPIVCSQPRTEQGFGWHLFHNFGVWAWATVIIQVLGGLLTAMVIKYSDNILKGFATSLSIVISFLASVALFDFRISFTFILGSVIVLIATWLYNQPSKPNSGRDALGLIISEKGRASILVRSPTQEFATFAVARSILSPSSPGFKS